MRDEPIEEIPAHIKALPKEEQGRALVDAILLRKWARNTREKFMQMMIYGDVHTDGHGNAIPRQEPEYWRSIRTAVVSGRGHGKNYAMKKALLERAKQKPMPVPEIAGVRWSCPKPTDIPLTPIPAEYVPAHGMWVFGRELRINTPQSSVKVTNPFA